MLNNPPNENQAAPGSNKILIIFLPLHKTMRSMG